MSASSERAPASKVEELEAALDIQWVDLSLGGARWRKVERNGPVADPIAWRRPALPAVTYDAWVKVLRDLAALDVAVLDELLSAAECWWEETAAGWDSSAVVAKIAAIRAAIEAARATQEAGR